MFVHKCENYPKSDIYVKILLSNHHNFLNPETISQTKVIVRNVLVDQDIQKW